MTRFVSTPIALFAGVLLTLATPALAQHADIQVQSLGGQIVTGGAIVSDDPGNSTLEIDFGERVFGDNLGSNFRALNPGFNSLETGNTLLQSAGALGFTEGTEFEFDLLPFTIDSTLTNFAYWDGMGEVEFGPPPSDTTWTISVREGFGRIDYTVDGTDTVVPGGPVGVVSDLERVHEHQRIEVERLGGGELEGVYLVSMQLRVDGFDTSDPIFLAHYSFNTSSAIGDLAQDWVRDNYDALIGLDDQLPGDINADGAVDLLDLDIPLDWACLRTGEAFGHQRYG
ncbi:MAG: hypothetical protein AAF266_03850, partial [Planctomycetota bacterium]